MRSAFLCLLLTVSFVASAQSLTEEPYYGWVTLQGGFLPDPHTLDLTAGGATRIQVSASECNQGHASQRPDLNLTYEGNGKRTLYIYATSDKDTLLLVNLPNASWRCDDDGYGDLDPIVVIPNAKSGLYNIWVGTYGDEMVRARLYVSEIDPR